MPKKICNFNGCHRIIPGNEKYCDEHKKIVKEISSENHKHYKSRRTDKKEQAFYNSKEWIIARDRTKRKFKGLCLYNYYVLNQIRYVDYVHHIVEIKEDWDKRLEEENLITCSDGIHKLIHNAYNKSEQSKREMQELLRSLIERFNDEFKEDEDKI